MGDIKKKEAEIKIDTDIKIEDPLACELNHESEASIYI